MSKHSKHSAQAAFPNPEQVVAIRRLIDSGDDGAALRRLEPLHGLMVEI